MPRKRTCKSIRFVSGVSAWPMAAGKRENDSQDEIFEIITNGVGQSRLRLSGNCMLPSDSDRGMTGNCEKAVCSVEKRRENENTPVFPQNNIRFAFRVSDYRKESVSE